MALGKKQSTGPEPIENFQNKGWQRRFSDLFRVHWREFSSPLVSSWLMTVQHFTMKKVKGKSQFLVTCFQLTRVVLPEYLFKAQTFLLDKYGEDTHKLKINLQRYQRTFTQTGKARNRSHPSQIAFASAEEKSFKMRPVGLQGCFTPVAIEEFFGGWPTVRSTPCGSLSGLRVVWRVAGCIFFAGWKCAAQGLVRYILEYTPVTVTTGIITTLSTQSFRTEKALKWR